ncbi:MAG TPA: hypothetical protein VFT46_06840 [Holophagaceae bacterium]|nr:hypothetical protein [Holophagaceae bacterium]
MSLLLAAGGLGCYRATGQTAPTTRAEQIPAVGGARVGGTKATAGPGDYFLGNDYLRVAVDGARFGVTPGQFGAASGGAILDIGGVALDTSYKQVATPTDNLERLGPVANQDPDLPLVFDQYSVSNTPDASVLTMRGYLLDPLHKLAGASWDGEGRVQGVTVVQTVALGSTDYFLTLDTQVTNGGASALPIVSLGDYLLQRGGGYRFIIPANQDASGAPLSSWGLDIPGSSFSDPLNTSVRAPEVILQGAEPSAGDLDSHLSLGILPADADQLMVASDPQTALGSIRPINPKRLVAGSLPTAGPLASGSTLRYRRLLFPVAGVSGAGSTQDPNTVFNSVQTKRASLRGLTLGMVAYRTMDAAAKNGSRVTEIRFERYVGTSTTPETDSTPSHWVLEYLTVPESGENPDFVGGYQNILLPVLPDPADPSQKAPYRIVLNDGVNSETDYLFKNANSDVTQVQPAYLRPDSAQTFRISQALSTDRSQTTEPSGYRVYYPVQIDFLSLRTSGDFATGATRKLTPGRFTVEAVDAQGAPDPAHDPALKRLRLMNSYFSSVAHAKTPITALDPGNYQFIGGNQGFGVNLLANSSPLLLQLPAGTFSYQVFETRGPLLPLATTRISAGQDNYSGLYSIAAFNLPLPAGYQVFDLPGPSQATTGGMLSGEELSSALAEGVGIVGRTEQDAFVDAKHIHDSFRLDFLAGDDATNASRLAVIGGQPYVVAGRTSSLAEGDFTSLFTAAPDGSLPFGGALASEGWTAADFIGQGGGTYVIAHRPRGPQGLFTAHPVAAGVALGTGANSWWTDTDPKSNGKRTGDFDAIELLRGEGCNPADPTAWFSEFKSVRTDWFNLLNLQTPASFTKALGLSSGVYSVDTPVGLARTYLNLGTATLSQDSLGPVATALRSGAAVASTGPLLDVAVGTSGPGATVSGTNPSVTLTVNVWSASWVPVDEVRVVVNGSVAATAPFGATPASNGWTVDSADARHWTRTFTLPMSTLTGGKDGWIVVEAGVPLSTTGAYATGTPWNKVMKGIYPVAVTNPIFVDVDGGGYTAPLP